MPFLFILLVHESRSSGPYALLARPTVDCSRPRFCSILPGLLALALAGVYAATLSWRHALVEFLLVTSLVGLSPPRS